MITRNNYEEFFLLYVDNELSAAARETVERFVAENPDLKEEWDLFLQCRIHPDQHLVFTGRESLFKQENDLATDSSAGLKIDTGNYEEYFLSYIDGELDEDARNSVEEFVRRRPSLLAELTALQLTVSIPDPAVVFENKASLYKKEKERRIVFFPWRIAAAALVAGVIGLLILNPFKKGPEEKATPPIASTKTGTDKPVTSATATLSPASSDSPAGPAIHKTPATQLPIAKKNALAVTLRPSSALHHSEAGEQAPSYSSPAKRKEDAESKALAQTDLPANTPVINQDPVRVATTSNLDGQATRPPVVATPVVNHPNMLVANADFATRALLNSSTGSPEDDGTMDSSPAKKNKLRGLFRKVTRVLEKNTSRDDDDKHNVLIGSFQFALK